MIKKIRNLFIVNKKGIKSLLNIFTSFNKNKYAQFGENSSIEYPNYIIGSTNIFIGNNVWINSLSLLNCPMGHLIIKNNVSIGQKFTAITFTHIFDSQDDIPESQEWGKRLRSKDVIINEHVWIGANVTLLPGCIIGRGSIVAAGSICPGKEYPPYTIIGGNPAKVIKFRLTLEQQIQHELKYFKKEDQISPEILKENYNKYSQKKSI